jgi:hypothetical protein
MRRFVIVGLVLLVAGAALLFGREWSSTNPPTQLPEKMASLPLVVEPTTERAEPPPGEATEHIATGTPSAAATTTSTLRGRLIDAVTRRSVAQEFAVRLVRVQRGPEWRHEQPLERTFQSETGRFSWSELPAETWKITVSARGYQQFDLGELQLAAGKKTREIVMPLLRGFAVRGRVLAAATGAGIAEAGVTFRLASAWPFGGERPYAKTKDDGSFVLDGIPGGEITLSIGAQGFAPRELELVVDEKTPPQDVVLSVGGRITGMVTTAAGQPVKTSVSLGTSEFGFGTQTNAAGQFTFEHLAPRRYQISTNGVPGSASQEIVLGPDERRDGIVLTVGDGRSVRGAIRGVPQELLKRTHISLRSQEAGAYFGTRADEQGTYTINGVPPGRARMTVYAGDRQMAKTLDVPSDRDVAFDIVFPAGARLSGRVTQDGKPAAQKAVWMVPAEQRTGTWYRATTSADGEYAVEGLPLGEYRFRADEDISRNVTIAGDAVLNVDIPLVQLGGRVVEDGGSVPIVGADVYFRGTAAATSLVHGSEQTNHFGEFSLTGIEPGEIVLIVYMAGYELYREKISYAAPITNKTIALRKSNGVEIRVQQAADKEPVRGLTVSETIPGNDVAVWLWVPLSREGVGSLPSALAGDRLEIQNRGDKPIVIEEWDGQSLELQL